ncbi:MAG: DUF4870 domain-containing protein [bacterium]
MSTESKPVTAKAAAANDNVIAAVATLPLVGLIMFFAMPTASKLVKAHAKQSNVHLAASVIAIVLSIIPIIGWCLMPVVMIVDFVFWVMQLIKAFKGEEYMVPVVGEFFDKLLK